MKRPNNMSSLVTIVIAMALFGLGISACGVQRKHETRSFAPVEQAAALVSLSNGGLRAGSRTTGKIADISADGKTITPVAQVDVTSGPQQGLLGLAIDQKQRTFAAWTNKNSQLVVAQVAPDQPRVIWNGPTATHHVSGRLAMTPADRVVVAIGDLGEPSRTKDSNAINGKLITLDPDRGPDQAPNTISSGWTDPQGIAYGPGGVLWVADARGDESFLARAGTEGPAQGSSADLGKGDPAGLTVFGDQELVVCLREPHALRRYLVDSARPVPGRTVADDCQWGVAELADGRLAYATDSEIRVTAH